MAKPRRLQEWEVTLFLVETEGDETTNRPWYTKDDIKQILQGLLHRYGKMRDLEVRNVYAIPHDDPYYAADVTEIPF